jgi:hypothetical protein
MNVYVLRELVYILISLFQLRLSPFNSILNAFCLKYSWKDHNETPCIAILRKQNYIFSKIRNRKVKQVLYRGWSLWEMGGYKERV